MDQATRPDLMKASAVKVKKKRRLYDLFKDKALYLMLLPGVILLVIFNYIPMVGVLIAFKDVNYSKGILKSNWVGFKNFEFFMKTPDAFTITRNTLLYNISFIILGLVFAVFFAIMLNEIRNRFMPKVYQSMMFLPYFLSWVVVSYLCFAFFNSEYGFLNKAILKPLGIEGIMWYSEAKYWPFILPFLYLWKSLGYTTVVYLAAITGIDTEFYEAAAIDGASKWQQITKITIPCLTPIMTIMTILAVGKIFNADFGLFYQTTLDSGALFSTTNVIDTYVFRALRVTGEVGMASAAGLYQAVVGFTLVMVTNGIVRKVDPDNSLF